MKIAIQLFGHLRTYNQCYQRLFSCLADNYECDIFIHTWDTLDHNTQTWHNFKVTATATSADIKKIIEETYQPKLYKIEKQKYQEEGSILANNKAISIFGMHMMLYSMEECNKLRQEYERKNGVKYDYIVILRPDVELWDSLVLENFTEATPAKDINNSFYFGGFFKYKRILNDWRAIGGSDVLFFGASNVIDRVFSHSSDLLDAIKNQELSVYGPEYAFLHAIETMGIKLQFIDYLWGEKYTIIRGCPQVENNVPEKKPKDRWYKKIIRFRISRKAFKLRLLTVIPVNLLEFEFNIFNFYLVNISIGIPFCWRVDNV